MLRYFGDEAETLAGCGICDICARASEGDADVVDPETTSLIVRKALSGLLTPEERIESRAALEVRQVFRVSKAGMVAGSFVARGVVNRNHRAKIMREGVLVRDNCTIASLKHFKDDVKEVRAGLECGIRLEGFDDVHVGDIIETYEIVQIARTL